MTTQWKPETVSVIGLGYIGLPTAAMFASRKVKVVGVDVSEKAVNTINQGKIHIVEPELDMIVHAAVTEGYLKATLTPEAADAYLIAVPTPFKGDHEPDLSYVEAASRALAPVLKKGDVVILESTSPVGATEQMAAWLADARPDLSIPLEQYTEDPATPFDLHIAYCPERVLPGHVVRELVSNDRIIGGLTPASTKRAQDVYRVFVEGELLATTARTAEMSKLTENAFRDVNIAFANELSLISDKIGVNVWELIELANHHPRVNILQPGCGVGGHCIAVDPWFIVNKTPELANITRTAREVNNSKPVYVGQKILKAIDSAAREKAIAVDAVKVAVLGLAFKPDIDDLRESPAAEIAVTLSKNFAGKLMIVEPNIDTLPAKLEGHTLSSLADALESADVVAILVAHTPFKEARVSAYSGKKIIDAAGVLRL